MMENAVEVFNFDEARDVRVIMVDGEPWFVAKDVCDILEIQNFQDTIARVLDDDERNVAQIFTLDGEREMDVISESGLYALVSLSSRSEARSFRKWVTLEVLPWLRKHIAHSAGLNKAKELELEERRLNVQRAQILQNMIENPVYPITDDSKRVLICEITRLVTGREHTEILPDSIEPLFSAADVGEFLGISNRKVHGLAVELGIKPPEGQSNEYGRWKMSKSPYSRHECSQFFFTEAERDRIAAVIPRNLWEEAV